MPTALVKGADAALETILRRLARTRLTGTARPDVSVVVPVFNHWDSTRSCLLALLHGDPSLALQVIVVDDASTDETAQRLQTLDGIDVVRNGENRGFVRSCNTGAAIAAAPLIYFLNNDAIVRGGTLRALIERIELDPLTAIAGSKLVYPDGRLQEAGGIIWSDGSGCNVGRGASPHLFEFSFAREVDYVSGASLLVRATFFQEVGGFDDRFAPAYYEDADLCFAARAMGRRVVYEPSSWVVHHEGVTSGTNINEGAKRFQGINRAKFLEKWQAILSTEHLPRDESSIAAAANLRGRRERHILFVDLSVPRDDRDAGGQRLYQLITGLRERGSRITFFPDDLKLVQPYTQRLQRLGVEVVYNLPGIERDPELLLNEAARHADVIWLSRPLICQKYLHAVRSVTSAPIVYDTVDLHHIRLRGQMGFEPHDDGTTWQDWRDIELACARAADATIAVTESEAAVLREANVGQLAVLPTIHDPLTSGRRTLTETSGLLFIGGFTHRPNVDAAIWFVRKIMPLVWSRDPSIRVTLLGADPPWEITEMSNDRVSIPGFIPDVTEFFRNARLFVAPLRYGAGVKGKIGQALSFALPIVTTTIGAEGFAFTDGVDARIADTAESFAKAIVEVYTDAQLWSRLTSRAFATLEPFRTKTVVDRALALLDGLISAAHSSSR